MYIEVQHFGMPFVVLFFSEDFRGLPKCRVPSGTSMLSPGYTENTLDLDVHVL